MTWLAGLPWPQLKPALYKLQIHAQQLSIVSSVSLALYAAVAPQRGAAAAELRLDLSLVRLGTGVKWLCVKRCVYVRCGYLDSVTRRDGSQCRAGWLWLLLSLPSYSGCSIHATTGRVLGVGPRGSNHCKFRTSASSAMHQKAPGMKSKGVPPIYRELSPKEKPAKMRQRLGPFQALNATALAF
jgi:hypothetical protein